MKFDDITVIAAFYIMSHSYIGKKNLEENFPHHNWILILSLQFVITTMWSVFTPSIYQFITTPRSPPEDSENEEVIMHTTFVDISLTTAKIGRNLVHLGKV